MDMRLERGRELASQGKVRQAPDGTWLVLSASKAKTRYSVNPDPARSSCTCPDFEAWELACKHIYAVRLFKGGQPPSPAKEQAHEDKPMPASPPKKKSYGQDWPSYNRAQIMERDLFEVLLKDLCGGVKEPPQSKGRPRLPLADVLYSCAMKVYTEKSGRRASSDIRASRTKGHIKKAPHHNSISRYLQDPALTPILTELIETAAAPLKAVETQFAADATGFSTCTYARWFDHKYGEESRQRQWLKCHVMAGTRTNVVTAVAVTPGTVGDTIMLPDLLAATAKNFEMREVSADKGYLSQVNLMAIAAHDAMPFIKFKINSTGAGTSVWQRMYHMFWLHRDEFLEKYHRRSNVETVFSMIKRKLGDSLRSKEFESQVNEVLCKILCHNIIVLIHEMHELGIQPQLGSGPVRSADLVDP